MNEESTQVGRGPAQGWSEEVERRLIEEAREGSSEAFGRLVERYWGPLTGFLRQLSGAMRQEDAEELAQEACLTAYRHLATYDSRWRFSTWLFTIGRRLAARAAGRRALETVPESVLAEAPASDPQPDERAAERQRRGWIWTLVRRQLGSEIGALLWLYYVEEQTVAEIGRALGRSKAWVKVGLFRARKRLAPLLRGGAR